MGLLVFFSLHLMLWGFCVGVVTRELRVTISILCMWSDRTSVFLQRSHFHIPDSESRTKFHGRNLRVVIEATQRVDLLFNLHWAIPRLSFLHKQIGESLLGISPWRFAISDRCPCITFLYKWPVQELYTFQRYSLHLWRWCFPVDLLGISSFVEETYYALWMYQKNTLFISSLLSRVRILAPCSVSAANTPSWGARNVPLMQLDQIEIIKPWAI